MRRLTSEQYAKIDAVAQSLPPSRRHAFLVMLAGKINLDARVNHNRTLSDTVLSMLIDAALRQSWQQRGPDPHADAGANELGRLIKQYSNS